MFRSPIAEIFDPVAARSNDSLSTSIAFLIASALRRRVPTPLPPPSVRKLICSIQHHLKQRNHLPPGGGETPPKKRKFPLYAGLGMCVNKVPQNHPLLQRNQGHQPSSHVWSFLPPLRDVLPKRPRESV
ncbi:unnamed protein product, partial [Trichogramma brassicae]